MDGLGTCPQLTHSTAISVASTNSGLAGLESQLEVRNITKRIVDLNERLDATSTVSEPRENAFIRYEWQQQLNELTDYVLEYGKVTISTTFPSLCRVSIGESVAFLECHATLTTVDYRGNVRLTGGDPVCGHVQDAVGNDVPCSFCDLSDGTYKLTFVPRRPVAHTLHVMVFNRHVRGSPFIVSVTEHNNPLARTGGTRGGGGALDFSQPTGIARDCSGNSYIVDTGNCRIKVLGSDGSFHGHLKPEAGLEQQSCTGVAVTPAQTLVTVNWRTKLITETRLDGRMLRQYSAPEFAEPTAIAVSSKGNVIVADNAADSLFIFDPLGSLISRIRGGNERYFCVACGLAIGINDEIVVAGGGLVRAFDADGRFLRTVHKTGGGSSSTAHGQYSGVTVDAHGNILATRTEKGRGYVDVFRTDLDGEEFFIDSFSDKLKRPSGIVAADNYCAVVCDLGNNCIKTYRYK